MRVLFLVLALLVFTSPVRGVVTPSASDPNGSFDLDLSLRVDVPTEVLISTEYDVKLVITNETTSEAPAYAVSAVVELPSSLTVVSSSLGTVLRTESGSGGTTRVAFESTRALAIGDTRTETVRVRASSAAVAGAGLDVAAWAYAEDSPFDRGAAPVGSPVGTPYGGVDISSPTSAQAQSLASSADDGAQGLPVGIASLSGSLASRASSRLILFKLESTPLVNEGERASGLTVNAFSSRLRLTGNGVASVDAITVEEVLPTNRAFLGWESLPAGVTGTALANNPSAGRTTLRLVVSSLPANQVVDARYRSGIPEYLLADSRTPNTTPASAALDDTGTSLTLVRDGTSSSTTASAIAATYSGVAVSQSLLPVNVQASVQVEFVAAQLGISPSTLQNGDHAAASLGVQVSEYVDLVAPATLDVTLPDGVTFDGGDSVTSTLGTGSFDATSGVADADGNTRVRYQLTDEDRLRSGASGTIGLGFVIDNRFEGSGETYFEAASSLRADAVVGATIADNGSTESVLLDESTADDSGASFRAPSPTMELRLLSVRTSDGVLYKAGSIPAYGAQTLIGAGSELEFALVATFPRVPTLGVSIEDALPLIAGPNTAAYGFRFITAADELDINGLGVGANDSNGDGLADNFFGSHNTLGTAASFPRTGLPNALSFDVGTAEPASRFAVAFKANVRDVKPETLTANGLIPYRNGSLGSFKDESGKTIETFSGQVDFTVSVPSVTLAWAKVVGPNSPMAGDTVTLQATLDNNGPVTAFLDPLTVTLPADWTYITGSAEIVDATGTRISALGNVTAPTATTLRIPLSETTRASLPADNSGTPTDESILRVRIQATLKQSVYPGQTFKPAVSASYYSVLTGGQNFGPLSKDVTLSVPAIAMLKELASTSEAFTTTTNLAIGEVATYRLTATLPQATLTNVKIVDQLPDVMELLAVRVVSVDSGLQLPAPTILTEDTRLQDGYRDRATITFGSGLNAIDGTGVAKKIIIELDARLKYAAANKNGVRPANQSWLYERSTNRSSTHTSTIREPLLQTTIVHAPASPDAHDTVKFTVTVSHAAGSATSAFDSTTQLKLPAGLEFVSASAVRTTGSFVLPVPTVSGEATDESPLVLSSYTLAQNTTLSFDVNARVAADTTSHQHVDVTTSTRWTTLPGASTEERVSTISATDSFNLRSAAVLLRLDATSLAHTTGSTLTIGETADVTLEVTPAEGVARGSVLNLVLPTGVKVVSILDASMGGALSRTGADEPVIHAESNSVRWTLGDVTNAAQTNAYAERIRLSLRCVVLNVAGNVSGQSLSISGDFSHDGDLEMATPLMPALAEPILTLDQYVVTQPSSSNDETLVLGIDVAAGVGSLMAYEPNLRVKLPEGVSLNGTITATTGPNPVVSTTTEGAIDLSTASLGGSGLVWSLRVPARLLTPEVSDRLESVAILTWTGQPGNPPLAINGDVLTGERTGSTTDPGGDANTYRTRNVTPTSPGFILAFEDLRGDQFNDFDFNDAAFRVVPLETSDANNKLTGLSITFEPLARGANFDHRLELDLNIKGGAVVTVHHYDKDGVETSSDSAMRTSEPIRSIKVLASTLTELPGWGGADRGFAANTVTAQAESLRVRGGKTVVTVEVLKPQLNPLFADNPATPALNERIAQLYGFSIVLRHSDQRIRHAWTYDAGTRDIVTSTAYPTAALRGYPIAQTLLVPAVWEYPTERTPIWDSHSLFADNIKSGGTRSVNWYTEQVNGEKVWPTIRDLTPSVLRSATRLITEKTDVVTTYSSPIVGTPMRGPLSSSLDAVIAGHYTGEIDVIPMNGAAPYCVNTTPNSDSMSSPLLVDLDGDGAGEILRGFDNGDFRVWKTDGTEILPTSGQALRLNGTIKSTPAVADLNNDGSAEVVVQTGQGYLYVIGGDLSVRSGFPVSLGGPVDAGGHYVLVPSPVVVELGAGRGTAIAAVSLGGRAHLVAGNGQELTGWPMELGGETQATPAGADIDLDGVMDLVFATESGDVVAVSARPTGPSTLWRQHRLLGGVSSPLIVNFNSGLEPEIFIGSLDGSLYGYDHDGQSLAGYPVTTPAAITASPCATDIDGDGLADILVGNDAGSLLVFERGAATPTTLAEAGSMILTGICVADMGQDQAAEVFYGSHSGSVGYLPITLPAGEEVTDGWNGFRGSLSNAGTRLGPPPPSSVTGFLLY